MKRVLSLILSLTIVIAALGDGLTAHAINTKTKSRIIHVVYDDSGSMANGVTSWSQAKYALEVFAAMMGESDTLVIYPMSSYSYRDRDKEDGSKSSSWGQTISISGANDAKERVDTINKMNGDNGIYRNTPIQTVNAAGDALEKANADEKWLIVLTDGAFDQGRDGTQISSGEIRETILGYAGVSGIRVAYVAIGKKAVSLKGESQREDFYPYDADTDSILETVTDVATTVFNYQPMPSLSGNEKKNFTTDIPVAKIIIFAQGEDVAVEDLSLGGKEIAATASVDVSVTKNTPYSPQNEKYKIEVAEGLKGSVLTFEADEGNPFAAGTFEFECSTDNVEVYFEPGVDIQAILIDGAGNEVNVSSDSVTSIEAGTKTVNIRMVNPLTGEPIDPESSALLSGARLSMTLKDEAGNVSTYADGDRVTISEGRAQIYAKAAFKGDIEKTSATNTLEVEPAQLTVTFSSEDGYSINPATLETSSRIAFQVTSGDGGALTAQEYQALQITVSDLQGLKWTISPAGGAGSYELTPEYAGEDGAAGVDTASQQLKIEAVAQTDGIDRKGSASAQISFLTDETVNLLLQMDLPEEKYEKGTNTYMFDCEERGCQEGAPYILITASVVGKDGTSRPLSEKEWIKGSAGFSFDSEAVNASFGWKLIDLICGQTLDFDVEPGDKVSTYKLYLSGLTATHVRANTSELTTNLKIQLDNGIVEEGSATGIVTVMPASVLLYVGWLLLMIAIITLIILTLIMEVRKPRFDRDMCPNTTAILNKAGVPITAPLPPQVSKKRVSFRVFPPWKPEERDITLKYPGYLDTPVTFRCVATGGGSFTITNLNKFQIVKEKVRFDGIKYDAMIKDPIALNMNSDIVVNVKKGNIAGRLELTFRRNRG